MTMISRFEIITTSIRPRTASMITVSLSFGAAPLAAAHRGTEQVDQLDPEVIDVDALGEDQSQVERQLQPAGQEYEVGQWPESSGRRGGRGSHRLFRLRGSKL